MPKKSYLSSAIAVLTALSMVLSGCSIIKVLNGSNSSPPVSGVGVTGTIKTGSAVTLSDTKIEPSGGTITVNKPGDPLNGMKITIPAGAYTAGKQFKVSYAPVESQTFGKDFNPITPLITVNNGGEYAGDVIEVKVPVKVPAGSFAMGFMYDPVSQKLEGMTTISRDADSITLATMHFSSFVLSSIAETALQSDVDSGFRPGVDDWKLPNEGSAITPNGNCSGMSNSAMWYYLTKPDGKNAHLYGRYDNNGNQPATPDFWRDDSLAYRFVSVCQHDDLGTYQDWLYTKLRDLRGYDDALNFSLFAYSMKMTGEPQYVYVADNLSSHAMVIYRIKDGRLYIADPNFKGDTERKITFSGGKFTPYSGVKVYNRIGYMAKSVSSDWNKIAQRWTEFKNKTIGKEEFPLLKKWEGLYYTYSGWWTGPTYLITDWQLMKEGVVFTSNKVGFMAGSSEEVVRPLTFRDSVPLPWDNKMMVELKPGANLLGFEILSNDEYVDFQYYNVTCNVPTAGLTVKPATQEAVPNQTIVFDLELKSAAPSGSHFEWFVDGVFKQKDGFGINVSFPAPGTHTITAKLVDASGKVLAEGQGTAVIKAPATPTLSGNNLMALQQMKTFSGNLQGQCSYKEKTVFSFIQLPMPYSTWKHIFDITWNGTSFSGTNAIPIADGTETNTLNGTVSSDGKTITSLIWTYSRKSTVTTSYGLSTQDNAYRIELKNIPVSNLVSTSGMAETFHFAQAGPEVKNYLTKLEYHNLAYLNGAVDSELTYVQDSLNWNAAAPNSASLMLHFSK
jgi:hypothetical protein